MFSTALLWLATQVSAGIAAAADLDTAMIAATVARCESSRAFDDGEVVLQVAVNRARKWRRTLRAVLTQPRQFAAHCPTSPRTPSWRHLALGIRAVTGRLNVPPWASRALWYCRSEAPGTCEARCLPSKSTRTKSAAGDWTQAGRMSGGCEAVGTVVHTFYGMPQPH